MNHTSLRLLSAAIVFLGTSSGVRAAQSEALQILAASGVKGGLVVHLGCGDGKLTAALRANESYLVQGLDADAGKVAAAREWIQSWAFTARSPRNRGRAGGCRTPTIWSTSWSASNRAKFPRKRSSACCRLAASRT